MRCCHSLSTNPKENTGFNLRGHSQRPYQATGTREGILLNLSLLPAPNPPVWMGVKSEQKVETCLSQNPTILHPEGTDFVYSSKVSFPPLYYELRSKPSHHPMKYRAPKFRGTHSFLIVGKNKCVPSGASCVAGGSGGRWGRAGRERGQGPFSACWPLAPECKVSPPPPLFLGQFDFPPGLDEEAMQCGLKLPGLLGESHGR